VPAAPGTLGLTAQPASTRNGLRAQPSYLNNPRRAQGASVSVSVVIVSASAATSPFDVTVRFVYRSAVRHRITTFQTMPRTCAVRVAPSR